MGCDKTATRGRWLATLLVASVCACGPADDVRPEWSDEAPGATPWHSGDDVTCTTAADCVTGEACEDGICVMARCAEPYESSAPLGKSHFFGTDAEVTVISDETFIDGFEATGGYLSSVDLSGSGRVLDVAGGNLTGKRPHTIAVAIESSDQVRLIGPTAAAELDIGIWPQVLAAGDVDGDGLDELVAFGHGGAISLCHVDEMTCESAQLEGATATDVAIGDVDGDGFAEPLFLSQAGDDTHLVVWNHDAETTGQDDTVAWSLGFPAKAFSAGDLDGDRHAEIVLLEDGGWWGLASDDVHVFSVATEQIVATRSVDGHCIDVALGDRNSDEQAEIGVLRDDQQFELMELNGTQQIVSLNLSPITVGSVATRISMVDWDGDSAFGRLVSGPELVAGEAVPVAALYFPPYPHEAAAGALSAKITLGEVESYSESLSDTLSLGVGLGVSFGAETPIFKAKVGAKLNLSTKYAHSTKTSYSVGARYSLHAQPELHGTNYAGVIMSCGCYHKYRYEADDPAGLVGGSGQTVEIYVPVGGQTQLWSSNRYNAMAEATGRLPIIPEPVKVGDPSSYPSAPVTTEGQPIPTDDLVFTDLPSFPVSDVGYVSYHLKVGESETNSTAMETKLGVNASFGAAGVSIDTNVSVGVGQGYSISVGKDNLFSGSVPPVPDNPDTPEDEYQLHQYAFTPVVYRHHYVHPVTGEAGAYYVMHHALGQ